MTADDLSAQSITRGLGTRFVGQRTIYYRRLKSTIDVARREARQEAAEGTVIITGEQTGGRGRRGRSWLSPRGSIALSIILYPDVAHLPSLIMLASLAVVNSTRAVTGLEPGIKWPNDVLINGKKVCGILIESEVRGDKVDYSTVSMGINVNIRLSDFPEIAATATSLVAETGRDVSRRDIVRHLLVEVERLYLTLRAGGSAFEAWRDNLVMLGKDVRVTEGEKLYQGIAESVARDGSLLLRQSDGKQLKIVAGDVSLRY
ncbi:MAG TPA: biotin--[acetyl-CoA-carboxylase] ligase [Dehalococcoidia bacterium]|nr:biotin--[acetyl-CoA-carboxylase] ligase [Dehalococcoidia bacterium]